MQRNVQYYIEVKAFHSHCSGVPVVLVGNKCDLATERYVTFSKQKHMYASTCIGLCSYSKSFFSSTRVYQKMLRVMLSNH